jgi:hypothetical protein
MHTNTRDVQASLALLNKKLKHKIWIEQLFSARLWIIYEYKIKFGLLPRYFILS